MKNKNKGNQNKIILGDFNWRNKMERDGGNKTEFIDAVSIMPCQNSSWIMDSRIYGEGITQISLSSPAIIDRIDRFYTDVKIASNTKNNHIMVSFTDHYNAIFIDRLPSQIKIGKEKIHGTLIILFYVSLSSPRLQRLFLLKTQKSHSSTSDWQENTKSCFKDIRTFLENSRKYQNFNTEERLRNLYKKENFEPEIEPIIENLQDELSQFENKQAETVKLCANIRWVQKMLHNFVQTERQNMQNKILLELFILMI